jgi:hypothetical protein
LDAAHDGHRGFVIVLLVPLLLPLLLLGLLMGTERLERSLSRPDTQEDDIEAFETWRTTLAAVQREGVTRLEG